MSVAYHTVLRWLRNLEEDVRWFTHQRFWAQIAIVALLQEIDELKTATVWRWLRNYDIAAEAMR